MRDLSTYANECMEMLDVIGIEYRESAFKVNTRATKRWGLCSYAGRYFDGSKHYEIQISTVLLDERNSEIGLIETIMHELLHTCEGCMNHGAEWKRLAEKVNREYGLNIKRTNSAEDKGVTVDTRVKRVLHRFVCTGCGQVIERQRESKFTQNYQRYTCGKCHCKFEKEF